MPHVCLALNTNQWLPLKVLNDISLFVGYCAINRNIIFHTHSKTVYKSCSPGDLFPRLLVILWLSWSFIQVLVNFMWQKKLDPIQIIIHQYVFVNVWKLRVKCIIQLILCYLQYVCSGHMLCVQKNLINLCKYLLCVYFIHLAVYR